MASIHMQSIIFKKLHPNEHDLLEQTFRLRLQVYGHESSLLDYRLYPDGLERDKYDPQSIHFAAINQFDEVIASVRLILNDRWKIPVWEHCPTSMSNAPQLSFQNTAEVSRLVVSKELLRRRHNWLSLGRLRNFSQDSVKLLGGGNQAGFLRQAKPVAYGLYREIYKECASRGINHVVALMESGLYSLLRMYGLHFECIGPAVDVLGPVSPYMGRVDRLKDAIVKYQFPHFRSLFQPVN
jgi:N-acyl amino acid synthase of PEP-CTERM/exosortase system